MDLEKLCLDLARVEDGEKVIETLKANDLWNNEKKNWRTVGWKTSADDEINNHSTIGNQQSNPANALVEKLVNCGDSALILNCRRKGIDPTSNHAPQTMKEAVSDLFGVNDGRWINATNDQKKKYAEEFCNLVVSGEKGRGANPTYTIIDSAEGQEPENFNKTFLSLTQKNKVGIKFVQGKFGMGSYGAVNFCTIDGLQLILSKRHPELCSDPYKNLWGFTVIRKIEPTPSHRSSRWVYLIIDEQIPQFESTGLKLLPGNYPEKYSRVLEHGSFIKLYNYDIGASLRTFITLDLYNKINTLLINPVVPVRLYERRNFSSGHSFESTLDGLETRLERDRTSVLADGFPTEFIFHVEKQRFVCKLYAFKKFMDEQNETLTKTDTYGNGLLFAINGQSNGNLPRRFFSTGKLKYENISKNLLVIVDCSELEPKFIEKLFQNDRERIFDNSFTKVIKDQIAEELQNHVGLRKFQNEWRKKEIESISDNQNTRELFEKLLKNNPEITKYLFEGLRLNNPFKSGKEEAPELKFSENFFPTYFELEKSYPISQPRSVEQGRTARVAFLTDAPNDYFTRAKDPGSFKLFYEDAEITHDDGVKLSGFNGKWHLGLPNCEKVLQKYTFVVEDISRVQPFENEFFLQVVKKREHKPAPPKPHSSEFKDLPQIIEINKGRYEELGFDEKDMLWIDEHQDGKNLFLLNMDNLFVVNYLKGKKEDDINLAKQQYKISMGLIGLVLIDNFKREKDNTNDQVALGAYVKKYTRQIAPVLMPLIRDIAKIL